MNLNFTKTITKSGVPLWILNMPASKTVASGVLIKAGTRDEDWPKEAGIAHALEHMHFQGTKDYPTQDDLSEHIEEVGGMLNAWTWKEMTFYYSQVPDGHAERSVHIVSQQLREPLFPKEKIITEMKTIVQEMRRAHDDPQDLVGRLSDKFVYGDHLLSRDGLGLEESVLAFSQKDFIAFREHYYNPANYTFIVAGNITESEAVAFFDKYFPEDIKQDPNKREEQKLEAGEERKFVKKKDIEQVHMFLSAPTGSVEDKETEALGFFKDMISGGMSFPLFQEVRDRKGLCYEIWAENTKWSDVGKFDIYIGTDPKRYTEAIDAVLGVIEKHKSNADLLEKVKNMKTGRLSLKYESIGAIINIAAQDIAFTGEPKGYDRIIEDIAKVNIRDVESAVDKYLKPESIYKTMLVPQNLDVK